MDSRQNGDAESRNEAATHITPSVTEPESFRGWTGQPLTPSVAPAFASALSRVSIFPRGPLDLRDSGVVAPSAASGQKPADALPRGQRGFPHRRPRSEPSGRFGQPAKSPTRADDDHLSTVVGQFEIRG
jgi:hypothetical protein